MNAEEALKLVGIDFSQIIHDESEENNEYVVFGSLNDEQIEVVDEGIGFVITLGNGRENYKVHKFTSKVENFKILVAN